MKNIIIIEFFKFNLLFRMADDDLLFDYMFLGNEDKEEENDKLREENEDLRDELNGRRTNISDSEEDYDKARFFAEDVQSIAADCGIDMEISYDEAERAIKQWYTPEDYYEYKMWL